jgi:hypothetical protein
MDSQSLYKRWLLINRLYPKERLAPSRAIDRVWHHRLKNSEKYRAECLRTAGYYLKHEEVDLQSAEPYHERLRELWISHFGEDLMGPSAACTKAPYND